MTQGEKLLWETRPTRWTYLPVPTLVLAVIVVLDLMIVKTATNAAALGFVPALPGPLSQSNPSASLVSAYEITAVVLLIIGILYFGVRWLHYASTVYVVTSTRVIRQSGILGKDYDEVQLLQVRGVDVSQKVWQRLFRYGTVRISAEFGGNRQAMGNEEWPGVPRPIEFERTIEEAQQRLRGLVSPAR